MRAFIGIDFSDNTKNEIANIQNKLKQYAIKGRWKHPDNFHITLKFLSEINEAHVMLLGSELEKICSDKSRFSFEISAMGAFFNKEIIRVLWLGMSGELQMLYKLYEEIDQSCSKLGFQMEKRSYKPHITIAQDVQFSNDFKEIRKLIGNVYIGPIEVNRICLFKSEQVQQKRVYTIVSEVKLPLI
jgi:2'-5' RNA ligase